MWPRSLVEPIERLCFRDHKMAFVSGPRQCGKTTLARALLKNSPTARYHSWDDITFRRAWNLNPAGLLPTASHGTPRLVFDELHKYSRWKSSLKGFYDLAEPKPDILVTGSARLNVFRKGGDSLLGRYFHFRLHPMSVAELAHAVIPAPSPLRPNLIGRAMGASKARQEAFKAILKYGTFPEPLSRQDEKKALLWRRTRAAQVLREDLRDLSRIQEVSGVEQLAALLGERVGTPVGASSLAALLEVAPQTVKRWLGFLSDLYFTFELKPFHGSIARSLRKEGKQYFWDPAQAEAAPARLENTVACHLLKSCHLWTDTGEGVYDLFYLRDKQKREVDFLITQDGKPWLPVEVKTGETDVAPSLHAFMRQLPCPLAVQLVHKPGYWKLVNFPRYQVLVADAAEVLGYFC